MYTSAQDTTAPHEIVEPWHPAQAVDAATALAASTAAGSLARATLMPGDTADLVVVDRDPLTADEPALRATEVQATLLAGRLTHAR